MRASLSVILVSCVVAHASAARADEPSVAPLAPAAEQQAQPSWSPAVALTTHMKSAPMVGVGTFLTVAGIAQIAAGAYFLANDAPSDDPWRIGTFAGGVTVAAGIAHLIPGVIMIGVGAQQVPVSRSAPDVKVGVGISPSGLGLHGTF